MKDPWKYLAFPAAAVGGYLIASTQVAVFLQSAANISQYLAEIAVVAVSGLIAGFLVDEVIPTYIRHVKSGSAAGDLGGEPDEEFDFE